MGNFEMNDKQVKRLFIAVKINPDNSFLGWYKQIKELLQEEDIRWTKTENFHITLQFLGDTNVRSIPVISSALKLSVVSHKPFRFSLSGIGVFRSLSYPKVFWIGLKNTGELSLIKESIDDQLKSIIDLKVNENFKPHLSLGRMKRIKDIKHFRELITRYNDHEFLEVGVEEVILYESILHREGPVYNVLDIIAIRV